MPPRRLLRLDRVTERFDRSEILPEFSLEVNSGDFLAVTGPNGGGKTTLLRLMLGLLKPSSGRVEYFAADGSRTRYLPFGYLPQKSSIDARFPLTVEEVVASGLLTAPGKRASLPAPKGELCKMAMELWGVAELAGRTLASLSGGQVQRALLARALVSIPEVIVFDEPLSYLDERYGRVLFSFLEELRGRATVVIVSHQMEQLTPLVTRRLSVDRKVVEL